MIAGVWPPPEVSPLNGAKRANANPTSASRLYGTLHKFGTCMQPTTNRSGSHVSGVGRARAGGSAAPRWRSSGINTPDASFTKVGLHKIQHPDYSLTLAGERWRDSPVLLNSINVKCHCGNPTPELLDKKLGWSGADKSWWRHSKLPKNSAG